MHSLRKDVVECVSANRGGTADAFARYLTRYSPYIIEALFSKEMARYNVLIVLRYKVHFPVLIGSNVSTLSRQGAVNPWALRIYL